ncbi:hypothetical protein H1P_320018 [Hyella patelloides LEGE 07179]|uniref:Uncharacterized protein n=1 Tax=Hyella patelloides LEGE 07179 TaxID=945734 RepID=A0A563VUY3_9CYAN|nr:hypothetical protein H1P_320018 [Hyella patelloides LEGE 07179]
MTGVTPSFKPSSESINNRIGRRTKVADEATKDWIRVCQGTKSLSAEN